MLVDEMEIIGEVGLLMDQVLKQQMIQLHDDEPDDVELDDEVLYEIEQIQLVVQQHPEVLLQIDEYDE